MSKRSIESRIVGYFETAPLATAQLVLGLVSAKVRDRKTAEAAVEPKAVARRKRRTKAEIEAAKVNARLKATSFDPAELVKQ